MSSWFVSDNAAPLLLDASRMVWRRWATGVDRVCLACDYIGAYQPQFDNGYYVGIASFSLRSRRLMLACRDPAFCDDGAAEDLVIARTNRAMLEERHGIVFANRDLVSRFSRERGDAVLRTFGFHGVFNLSGVLGMDGFWDLYRSLDHRGTVRINF